MMKKLALISVSDKTDVVSFAEGLQELNYNIISTGGTLRSLNEAGIDAKSVEDITEFPEILDGRVKTLHPYVHGGLLAKQDNKDHLKQLAEHGIQAIDLVAVNLYPFKETLNRTDVSQDEIIENIDIGGPTMLRAAAKNFESVTVVVDPDDYQNVLSMIKEDNLKFADKQQLAAKVFRHTAHYDALIADFFNRQIGEVYPETYTVTYEKAQDLRYGENPHQKAAFYKDSSKTSGGLASAIQLHGKELSYNNIQDANSSLEILSEYKQPTAVAVKHMNPCGIGVGTSIEVAFQKAYEADSMSIFGGIVALNQEVTKELATKLSEIFLEIVIAPSFSEDALEILTKKKNIRLLKLKEQAEQTMYRKLATVKGGMLVQDADQAEMSEGELSYPTNKQPTEQELKDLLFSWKAVKHVKSNAIVLAKDDQTVGIGAGQMNRVGAAKIAIEQAGKKAQGAVMASDAFFPMSDTVETAAKVGVKAIIQPGGSKRDQESIDMCDQYGIAMVFTGMRHFKH